MSISFRIIRELQVSIFLLFTVITLAQESSYSLGNTFIHSEGNMTEFNNIEFSNQNNGSQPGIIGGERVPGKGYFNFAAGAGWTNAQDLRCIDGYARYFGNAPFLFPIGDNGKFRPAAVSGGSFVEASYYGVNPTTAITSDIRGGDFPVLPGTGPFNSALKEDIITNVSEWEYWDINGTDPTIITLTWDPDSNVDDITNNDLERLTIVGWNGTQWEVIPSEIDFRTVDISDYEANFNGSTPSIPEGSISTTSSLIPSDFEVYTLAASCANIEILANRSELACLGQELSLNASSTFEEATLNWSTGETGNNITLLPTEDMTISVTANVAGCEATRDIDIIVKEVFVDLGQDTFACRGQELLLSPNGTENATYQWDDGNTIRFADEISVNVNTPRDIFLTVTDSDGCTASDQISIEVREGPDVSTGRDRIACLGESVRLQAFGATNNSGYVWSTGDTLSEIFVTPLETTIYEVSLTENGCTDIGFSLVEVFPAVTVEIVSDSIICGTEEVTIQANGSADGEYTWSNGDTGESITVSPVDGETFTVTISTPNAECIATDEITFSVFEGAQVGEDLDICEGQEVSLELEGFYDTVAWSTGSQEESLTIQPDQTTTYSVTTTFNGCTGVDEVTVNVTEDLTIDLGEDMTICKGELVTLGGQVAGQYFWSNGMNSPTISIVPFITTTYSVTVYSGDCEATDEITINVDEDAAFVNIITDPLICPGSSVNLVTDGSAGFYQWSNGNFGESIIVNGQPGSTYAVTVTSSNGCTDTDEITLQSFNDNALDIGEDKDICIGETLTLEAPGDWDMIEWSNGSTESSINITPLNTETYSVTITQDNCQSEDEITINVGNSINLDLGEDIFICQGESVILGDDTVSGDFDWDNGQTSSFIEVSPLSTTTYVATVNSGSCNSTDEITVHVEATNVEIIGDNLFCEGEEVTLTATGSDGTYRWSNGVRENETTFVPIADIVYSVTVTSDNGCTATDEFTFQSFDEGEVNLGDDIEICSGGEATLGLSGIFDSAIWSDGSTGGTLQVSPTSTTTYSVTAQFGACEVTDEITVNVVNQINLDLGSDIAICGGQEVELTGNVGGTYEWNTGFTGDILTVMPTETTLYTATVTSGSCTAVGSINVIVENLANVNIIGDEVICNDEEVTIQAMGSQGDYLWNTGQTTQSITLRPFAGEEYSVTVTTSTGCTAADDITFSSFEDGTVSLGQDLEICIGGEATLSLDGNFDNIEWSTNSNAPTITVSPTETTNYSVTANKGNCTISDVITVNVVQSLDLDLGSDITICSGQEVSLEAWIAGDYVWSTNESAPTINVSPNETTTYTATVTSGSCTDTDDITVIVENIAFAEIVSDSIFCSGETITLTADGTPGLYEWNTGATGTSTTFTPTDNTVYSVTVTTDTGCQFSDEITARSFESNYIDLGEDITSCVGEAITLSFEGIFDSVIWSNGETTPTITVRPTATETFSVTAEFNGCTATDEIQVVIVSDLDLDLGPDKEVCAGIRTELISNISGTYSWSTGETTRNIFVTPEQTTTYSVTITSGSCTTEDEITLDVIDSEVTIIGEDVLCSGGLIDLTAMGPATAQYNWSNGDTGQNISLSALPNVSYRVTMTTVDGCQDSDEIIFSLYDDTDIDLGNDLTVCAGEEVSLSVSGLFQTVEWSTGENTEEILVSPIQTTTYSIVALYENCTTTEEVTIFVTNDLTLDLGSDIVICPGGEAILQDVNVGGNFQWSTNETTESIIVSPNQTTTYSVSVNSGTCTAIDEVTVIIQDDCLVDLSIEKTASNFTPSAGDEIEFQVAVTNGSSTVDATNVVVLEEIRSGFDFISYESTAGTYNPNTSQWTINNVPSNTTEILTITVVVLPNGDHSNAAIIIGVDQEDPDSEPDDPNDPDDPDPDDPEDDTVVIQIEVGDNNNGDPTGVIGNRVWFDRNGDGVQDQIEIGIENIRVSLFASSNINAPLKNTTTDEDGAYLFDELEPGDYFVQFEKPEGMLFTKSGLVGGGGNSLNNIDSDVDNVIGEGTTRVVTLGANESILYLDAGMYEAGSIGDYVWFDAIGGIPGRQDDMLDSGQPDITLHLLNEDEEIIATTITDENGFYIFEGLAAANYFVSIELTEDSNFALVNPNQATEESDSDFIKNLNRTPMISLEVGEINTDIDAGLTVGTLALTLVDFWGERIVQEELNRLFWASENEDNTFRFIVERSLETFDNFIPIGEVEAAGSSTEKIYYSFDDIDSKEGGLYYYRLVMQDLDGTQTYSKIITIRVDDSEGSQEDATVIPFKVYPIPTYDLLTLEIDSPLDYEFRGYLVNNLGQNVRKIEESSISQGVNQITLNVTDLAQGEYYLNFYIGEKQYLSRVLKLDN